MSKLYVASYQYQKKAGDVKEYNVDDSFIEFLHMLKKNGSTMQDIYELTDPLVNHEDGLGWTHSHSLDLGIAKSHEAAVQQLINHCQESGDYDEEDMQTLKQAFSQESSLSDSDKNAIRRQSGISQQF